MAVLAIGISHRGADVGLLERLSFGDDDFPKAYRRAADDDAVREAVVVSTCNRVEVYGLVDSYHAGFLSLKRLLCETRGVGADELAEPLYSHYEDGAVEHLFSVAAGLDSMVLGEPQILSQVRAAQRRATAEGAAAHELTALFHAAARTGRRARAETGIGAAPDAFVDAGASLAEQALGRLSDARAVVVGAGHMAALAAKHLRSRGVADLTILNRSAERASSLAERTGARAGSLSDLRSVLAAADLVVSSTGATGVVLSADDVGARDGRPLFILDLAVPRDVDPAMGEVAGVTLVDLTGLRQTLEARNAGVVDVDLARQVVAEEVKRFVVRRRSEHLAPVIVALRRRGEEVVAGELERYRGQLADLTPDERQAVEALARSVVSKLLHDPIVELKERAGAGVERAHARLIAELFGIDPPSE
jgi:glutamyl-tRNA reductase